MHPPGQNDCGQSLDLGDAAIAVVVVVVVVVVNGAVIARVGIQDDGRQYPKGVRRAHLDVVPPGLNNGKPHCREQQVVLETCKELR